MTISTWDCSIYSPGFKTVLRFWYDLEIRATDAKGGVLDGQTLKDDDPERRKLSMKTKPKNLPTVLYQELLPQIVRDNRAVLEALKN